MLKISFLSSLFDAQHDKYCAEKHWERFWFRGKGTLRYPLRLCGRQMMGRISLFAAVAQSDQTLEQLPSLTKR